jgi:hypothetical protein
VSAIRCSRTKRYAALRFSINHSIQQDTRLFGPGFPKSSCDQSLNTQVGKLAFELGYTSASIQHVLVAAGPCRVGGGVDIEVHGVPLFAPSGAGMILGTIGHDDFDGVVIGMNVRLHGMLPVCRSDNSALRGYHHNWFDHSCLTDWRVSGFTASKMIGVAIHQASNDNKCADFTIR